MMTEERDASAEFNSTSVQSLFLTHPSRDVLNQANSVDSLPFLATPSVLSPVTSSGLSRHSANLPHTKQVSETRTLLGGRDGVSGALKALVMHGRSRDAVAAGTRMIEEPLDSERNALKPAPHIALTG